KSPSVKPNAPTVPARRNARRDRSRYATRGISVLLSMGQVPDGRTGRFLSAGATPHKRARLIPLHASRGARAMRLARDMHKHTRRSPRLLLQLARPTHRLSTLHPVV